MWTEANVALACLIIWTVVVPFATLMVIWWSNLDRTYQGPVSRWAMNTVFLVLLGIMSLATSKEIVFKVVRLDISPTDGIQLLSLGHAVALFVTIILIVAGVIKRRRARRLKTVTS